MASWESSCRADCHWREGLLAHAQNVQKSSHWESCASSIGNKKFFDHMQNTGLGHTTQHHCYQRLQVTGQKSDVNKNGGPFLMHEIQCLSYSKIRGEKRNKAQGKQSGQGSHQDCTCIPDYILYVNAVCLQTPQSLTLAAAQKKLPELIYRQL